MHIKCRNENKIEEMHEVTAGILADFQLLTLADFQVLAVPVKGAAVDEGRDEEVPPGTGGHGHCHATR